MSDFKEFSNTINAIIRISNMIRNTSVTSDDIRQLGRINDEICDNIEWLSDFIHGENKTEIPTKNLICICDPEPEEKPEVIGKEFIDIYAYPGYGIDELGNVYDTNMHILPHIFICGEVRVKLGDNMDTDVRRLCVLMSQAFKLGTGNPSNGYICRTKSGDARDLRRSNIIWVPGELNMSVKDRIYDDISRRIVEFDGDIDKILSCYPSSEEFDTQNITEEDVINIINKNKGYIVSNSIFTVDKSTGTIIPTPEVIEDMSDKPEGFDVFSFLLNSKDTDKSIHLIKEKITQGRKLSFFEREIVVLSSVNSFDGTTDVGKDLVDKIKSDFCGYTMSQGYINRILNKPNSVISKIIFGGIVK